MGRWFKDQVLNGSPDALKSIDLDQSSDKSTLGKVEYGNLDNCSNSQSMHDHDIEVLRVDHLLMLQ